MSTLKTSESDISDTETEHSCCESDEENNHHRLTIKSTTPPQILVMEGTDEMGHIETPDISHGNINSFNEERMRRKLQFFFMNPIEKWQARRRFPYKFTVQVIKIILVTIQLCLFAHSRYNHVNYTWDNRITFSHLFLRGWDTSMEVTAYPPSTGPNALYVQEDFFLTIDYALDGYAKLDEAIGAYSYANEDNNMVPIEMCMYSYKEGTIFGFNESYIFNGEIYKSCLPLAGNVTEVKSKAYLAQKGIEIQFSSLVRATLQFSVKTVNFKAANLIASPDCYQFDIEILFDNVDHDGQMKLSLEAEPTRLHCKDGQWIRESEIEESLRTILNVFVMFICSISFILCTRALWRAYLLCNETQSFFKTHLLKELSWDGRMEFLNIWYIMIILNDILLILGSFMKQLIEGRDFAADSWNVCSVLLGIGNLLVWFGVLRYLGFFKTYNVVILTLKRAAPKISRFLLCALLIYGGFTFCGWLVLGPYHAKFRSLATTSECLFALINGDDMFATFLTMSSKSELMWWFSRIYLYSFISLYIYVVLSLFIAVIMDAYDTIKRCYKNGFPKSDLQEFIGVMNEADFTSGVFRIALACDESLADVVRRLLCWRRRGSPESPSNGPSGYTSLSPGVNS